MGSTQFRQEVLKVLNALDPSTVKLNGTLIGVIDPSVDVSGLDLSSNTTATIGIADRGWTISSSFSSVDADTVQWGTGTFTASDGTAYSIASGNTGNMAARTFIYLDVNVSTTDLQTSTTPTDAIGTGRVLIGVAENNSDQAFFQVFGGIGGVLISANEIAANTITANEIAANTITASQIAATTITGAEINATFNLSTKNLTADTGTVGGWTLGATSFTAGTGGTTVGLDSGGSNPAVYAGSATPASAPFRVTNTGDMTATSATITGAITATSGSIGGWTINATSLSSGSFTIHGGNEEIEIGSATAPLTGTGIWAGNNGGTYEFRAGNPAANYIHWDGSSLTVVGSVSGTIDATDLTGAVPIGSHALATQGWTYTGAFSSTDSDTVAWATGTFTTAGGTNYSITGGNTGNMTVRTYIYLDIDVSTTTFQTTTTAATAVGVNKVLIAVAEDATGAAGAFFQVFGGVGGLLVTANEIAANAITANEIAATTITGAEIFSLSISGKSITADTGTIGGWTLSANSFSSGSFTINATNEEIEIGSATAPLTGTGIWVGKDGSDYEFRAGNPAGDYIHWDGSTLNVVGQVQFSGASSFTTDTWTGFSSAPSGDLNYFDMGTHVMVWNDAAKTGTSNANTFTVGTLPSAIRPTAQRNVPCLAVDNSGSVVANAAVNTSGLISMSAPDAAADWGTTNWTTSANKGLAGGWIIFYAK